MIQRDKRIHSQGQGHNHAFVNQAADFTRGFGAHFVGLFKGIPGIGFHLFVP